MNGYNPNFLPGYSINLPGFASNLQNLIVRNDELDHGFLSSHPNYAIATRGDERAPVFSVLCIDQKSIKKHNIKASEGAKSWAFDKPVGEDYQLNNDYYKDWPDGRENPWDRGHMAMRKNAASGETRDDARKASKETYYWSNCSLQHKNFNQDEWQGLEMWIQEDLKALEGKIISFALPIFSGVMRSIKPEGRRAANVPAGYCKVIAYVETDTNALQTRAFIMWQDVDAIQNGKDQSRDQLTENGKTVFNYQRYQVSTTLVESYTGVIFPQELKDTNPMYFHDRDSTRAERERLGIRYIPEFVEVDNPSELVSTGREREVVLDDEIEIYVAAAMPNPEGSDHNKEWVSVANYGSQAVDLKDWELKDAAGCSRKIGEAMEGLSSVIEPGQSLVVKNLSPMKLPNVGGVIILRNQNKERIDRVNYFKEDFGIGIPVNFFYQRSMISS